jgi:hypothetical protein
MVFSGRGKLAGGECDAHFQKHVLTATSRFWDAYLKGDRDARRYLPEGALQQALGDDATVEHRAGNSAAPDP